MNEYIVGIDLGSSSVCAAVGRIDKLGGIQISGVTTVECSGLKKGIVVDIDAASESVRTCIEQLEGMVDIEISSAYVSLPGGISELVWSKGVIAISSEDSEITANDIERVLKAAKIIKMSSDKEIIGVIPEQYAVDGYNNIKDPRGMSGLRLEVDAQIVTAQTTVVNNLFKSINKAGIKVSGLVLQPVALSNVVLKDEEAQMGTALVDVGAETIDIAVYKGGNLRYTGMIPLGGNIITNDVAVCLKIPFSQAERLKLQYSAYNKSTRASNDKIKVNDTYNNTLDIDTSMLSEIIEARVEEILLMIKKKLKESGLYDSISGIVLVGGGLALINGINELGRNIINKPVRIGAPDYVGASSPVYAVAIGIVKNIAINLRSTNADNNLKTTNNKKQLHKEIASYDDYEDEDEVEGVSFISKIKQFFTEFF